MSLQNQLALITGGCKNLGAAIAAQLAAQGASLALHYNGDATKPSAEKLLATLSKQYPDQHFRIYQADLRTASTVQQLFAQTKQDFNTDPNIIINTVGQVLKKPFIDITEAEYDSMFERNSKAAFLITQEAARHVKDGGKIINLVTALLGAYTGLYSSYQASKASVEWYTKALSKELAERSISVNAIAPGPMDTPFLYGQESPESVEWLKSVAMGGRLTKVEDIAPIVRFLCTEGAWISGQVIFANGGFSTR